MGLNPEQIAAINHHDGSLVLSAGAGSGKTRVLVERYLKLVRDGCSVRNLVAITYTEKAAREMRLRIRAAMEALLPAEPQWTLILQDLETAAIDTIHGYCRKLLAEHEPKSVSKVLDESIGSTVIRETVTSTLQTILLGSGPLTHDLHELIVLFGWPQVRGTVEEFLLAGDRLAWPAFAARTPEDVVHYWLQAAENFSGDYIKYRVKRSPEIGCLADAVAATPEGTDLLNQVRQLLAAYCAGRLEVGPTLKETATIGGQWRKISRWLGDSYETMKTAFSDIREIIAKANGLKSAPPNLAAAAEVALRLMRVVIAVEAAYSERKRSDGAIDFSDMIERARRLLEENAAARESIHQTVRYVLLDELQDTDPVQIGMVKRLLGERFSSGGLFAVGDAKQSIYGFRGADLALFTELRQALPRKSLTKNYRSVPGIIRFVNGLCEAWFPEEEHLEATQDEQPGPAIEFLWTLVRDECTTDAAREADARSVARHLKSLIDSHAAQPGEMVLLFRSMSNVSLYESALRREGMEYYLVGGKAFFAQQEVYDLANVLRAVENPFDAIAMVATMRSPFGGLSDDAVTAIVHQAPSPWEGLEHLERVPPGEVVIAERLKANLIAWRAEKNAQPVARLVQRIIADTEYDAALLFEPLGERKLANLWKLQEIARQFDANGFGLAEFVDHLENLVAYQPREDQAATVPEHAQHVVRLMTIHQAKGLEFPVVVVPDLHGETRNSGISTATWHRKLGCVPTWPPEAKEADVGYPDWAADLARLMNEQAEAEESLRILYVACTRPERRLILSGALTDDIVPRSPALKALAKAYDLGTGRPHRRGEAARVVIRASEE